MIISASRRTDIPAYYMDWFLKRLKEGYALVRNPMNHRQVSRVELTPETIDFIVFWTKNAKPLLEREREINYPYYVQFSINPYGEDIEENLPPKSELIDTFKRLSEKLGKERVVWRYSPVLFNDKYDEDTHLEFFEKISTTLNGYTERCNLSFLDMYPKIEKQMQAMGIDEATEEMKIDTAKKFFRIAGDNGIALKACGNLDINKSGIPPAKCIDDQLIAKLIGSELKVKKDPGQPSDCFCSQSVDLGSYNTCLNGCMYCYANSTESRLEKKTKNYNLDSPMLCDEPRDGDKVTDRKMRTVKTSQIGFDIM